MRKDTRSLLVMVATAAAIWLGGSVAHGAHGTLTFHATVNGKASESGTFRRSEVGSSMGSMIGCGIVTHKKSTPYGHDTYIVRTGPSSIPGSKPAQPSVLLVVYRYKPGSAASYTHLDVGGTFAINQHAYAGHPTSASTETVQIAADGRSGTWTEPDGFRYYPAKVMQPLTGFGFKASWSCSTVYQFHD